MKTSVKKEIMKLSKKWRTYDVIDEIVRFRTGCRPSTIEREARRLVVSGEIERKPIKGKVYFQYRKV